MEKRAGDTSEHIYKKRICCSGGSLCTIGTKGTILLCNAQRHYLTVGGDSDGGIYLCLADNAVGPCVAGRDEGEPKSNGEPNSPIWPAKQRPSGSSTLA